MDFEKLTNYFNNYFKYNQEKLSDKEFYMNIERQKLFDYLFDFHFREDINIVEYIIILFI